MGSGCWAGAVPSPGTTGLARGCQSGPTAAVLPLQADPVVAAGDVGQGVPPRTRPHPYLASQRLFFSCCLVMPGNPHGSFLGARAVNPISSAGQSCVLTLLTPSQAVPAHGCLFFFFIVPHPIPDPAAFPAGELEKLLKIKVLWET